MKYISGAQVNHIVNEDLNGEFAGFKTIILCCVHSIWFMKNVFSAKSWLVITCTSIMKYESRVLKSNPVLKDIC